MTLAEQIARAEAWLAVEASPSVERVASLINAVQADTLRESPAPRALREDLAKAQTTIERLVKEVARLSEPSAKPGLAEVLRLARENGARRVKFGELEVEMQEPAYPAGVYCHSCSLPGAAMNESGKWWHLACWESRSAPLRTDAATTSTAPVVPAEVFTRDDVFAAAKRAASGGDPSLRHEATPAPPASTLPEDSACGCGHARLTEHSAQGCLHGCPVSACVRSA